MNTQRQMQKDDAKNLHLKKQVGTINLAPTPTGYAMSLINILEHGGNAINREWAKEEIIRLVKAAATLNPEAWGKEN